MAWKKDPALYWKEAPRRVHDYLVPSIDQYYNGNPQMQRDEAMRSCVIAGMNLMLVAKSMGYDTCSMYGLDFDMVAKLLRIPAEQSSYNYI